MAKNKGCMIRVKGGERCGNPLVPGRKYCQLHTPLKIVKPTTYSIGKTKFDGNKTVKTSEYSLYLQSPEWREKANKEKEKNPNCSLCNRKGELHVHHRTYVRCGQEQDGDLIVLCSDCHNIFHKCYKYDGRVGHFIGK